VVVQAGLGVADGVARVVVQAGLSVAAGVVGVVTAREADDLMRDAESFVALVEGILGVPHQSAFPLVG